MTTPTSSASLAQAGAGTATHTAFLALLAAVKEVEAVPIRERSTDATTALGGGDYDLLVAPDAIEAFLALLARTMAEAGVSYSVRVMPPAKWRIALHAPGETRNILIEVWSRLLVRDPTRRCRRWIDWADLSGRLERGPTGVRMPADIEAAYYLSHLASKGKTLATPLVRERLAGYRTRIGASAPALTDLIDRLGTDVEIPGVASAANGYLMDLGVLRRLSGSGERLGQSLLAAWERTTVKIGRLLRGRSLIAVTGPDGVGKTTIIGLLTTELRRKSRSYRFKNLFRHNPLYRLVDWRRRRGLTRLNGGKLPANRFDELVAPTLFRIAKLGFPWLWLRSRLFGIHCCDRYYHDFCFADLRSTTAVPHLREGWQDLARRMPRPSWHLHLDAPDAVILGRRRELTVEGLRCYRAGLAAIAARIRQPYYTYLNTAHDGETTRTLLRKAAADFGLRFRAPQPLIDLGSCDVIGKGHERVCYAHPDHPDRVIKVTISDRRGRNQNRIDDLYLTSMERRGIPFDHVPRRFGWVRTLLGPGLVVERVMDPDGTRPLSIDQALAKGLVGRAELDAILSRLYDHLMRHGIVMVDVATCNILLQRRADGWHPMIVDGLGARHIGLKFALRRRSLTLSRLKLRKNWPILLAALDRFDPAKPPA